ncbi:MAG: adenylate/guanylate cyclase domain-containing protein [Clostridia bacterium]|nr:adenylate/guanylate cyclase domain-containing protein [Clostridia bacterium]
MIKQEGLHFYINIDNFSDIVQQEEKVNNQVNHSIHALDTFFSSIEYYGSKYYSSIFHVEKITGSRLHLYATGTVREAYECLSAIAEYSFLLTAHFSSSIAKYKSLLPFIITIGAAYGHFYDFQFVHDSIDESTTIGYAANLGAKIQGITPKMHLAISESIWEALYPHDKEIYQKVKDGRLEKYEQSCYYAAALKSISSTRDYSEAIARSSIIAQKTNLTDMEFRGAVQPLAFSGLSTQHGKRIQGIPLFADVRGFTKKFDSDDANLEEMAATTQRILVAMYSCVKTNNGVHVQFQGDRELALFHDYPNHICYEDAVLTGMRIIDAVKPFNVSVGVGQAYGTIYATKIGARGQRDNLLIGSTVLIADELEDSFAAENQIAISAEIYFALKQHNPMLAKQFVKISNSAYIATIGYNDYKDYVSHYLLARSNQQNSYNGAWSE